jgi:hypothetical protein
VKIFFDKVSYSKKPFKLRVDNISLQGSLERKDYHKVKLEAILSGEIDLICYRCGKEFKKEVNTPLDLTLSNKLIATSDDLDIIEFADGIIDLEFILKSEISSIQNYYNLCETCKTQNVEFEQEF